MSDEPATHRAVLELDEPVPPEVLVGSPIEFKLRLSCPDGCDLSTEMVRLVAGEATIAACERDRLLVRAPAELGSFTWVLVSPPQEIHGVPHEPVSRPISFVTIPVGTSLAIWDVPSPVIVGARFAVKVGAKSREACLLKGATVDILDDAGVLVGSGQLGEVPWEGTCGLYWTEVELPAPVREGIVSWQARFVPTRTGLPHAEAMARFSVAAVKPPDFKIAITFADKDTKQPIEHAQIRLGLFRATTDACGRAELSMPRGSYEVKVWHPGYESPPLTVELNENLTLHLPGIQVLEEDPSGRWMM
jgi:hypothetical protein